MRLKRVRERFLATVLALIVGLGSTACGKDNGGDGPEEPDEPNGNGVAIATFNIAYDNRNAVNERAWENRREPMAELITNHAFDVFGAQEPLYNQLQDLEELLPDYAYFGLSRDGKEDAGEFAPIFYNKETVEVLESGQFWLTHEEDKSVSSIGWDARYPRTCVWLKVRHKETDATFYVFNVHFDHIGSQARRESTRLLMAEVPQIAEGYPYFLLGDFNFDQNGANYNELQGSSDFVDTYGIAERNINGDRGTFPNYNPNHTSNVRIDHIFVNRENAPTISRHEIITDTFRGNLTSDHFPVMVEVEF